MPLPQRLRLLDDVVTVDDSEMAEAMALRLRHLRVVVEPRGACGLAALVAGKVPAGCGRIAVVLSGGNVDWHTFRALIDNNDTRRLRGLPRMPSCRRAVSSAGGA
jgi:threo-3-hydroxy-L-aspartate ammonia-lyase